MFTKNQTSFIELVEEKFGKEYVISRQEVLNIQKENNIGYPAWLMTDDYRVGRGMFKVPSFNFTEDDVVMENIVPMKKHTPVESSQENLIPERDSNFEKFGFYSDLKSIIKSNKYFPTFITGQSGTGKSFLVEQVCAELKRECIRVNFSIETDEVALLGGPTLVNGNIVHTEGPIISCLRNGYILLLDELDRANQQNLLIINGILEGKGYYNPRTGEYIKAKEGFNVISTANTKGFGSDDGKYLAQIMDTAFLERFFVTFEQPYPTEKTEMKILGHHLDDVDFIEKLVKWASVIRKTNENGGVDEIISTRRLVHIAETYNVFKNKLKAIELCCSRYETHVKDSFIDLYKKVDANLIIDENGDVVSEVKQNGGFHPEF